MMQLSMTGEYAIRAMLYLASKPAGTLVQINEISESWDIPVKFLRKIVQRLARSGLIISHRGIGGGIELSKPAESTTLLEVIEATEGEILLNKCLIRPGMCIRDSWCAVHLVWSEVQEKMKEMLSAKSLADLAKQSLAQRQNLASQKYQIENP